MEGYPFESEVRYVSEVAGLGKPWILVASFGNATLGAARLTHQLGRIGPVYRHFMTQDTVAWNQFLYVAGIPWRTPPLQCALRGYERDFGRTQG